MVVIVVIGILASIATVSYTGYLKRAAETAVRTDLIAAGSEMKSYASQNGEYPSSVPGEPTPDVTRTLAGTSATTFCVTGTSDKYDDIVFHVDQDHVLSPQDRPCGPETAGALHMNTSPQATDNTITLTVTATGPDGATVGEGIDIAATASDGGFRADGHTHITLTEPITNGTAQFTYQCQAPGDVTVTLTASNGLTSSATITCESLTQPEPTLPAKVTGLRVSGGTLFWNAVPGTTHYEVNTHTNLSTDWADMGTTTNTSMTLGFLRTNLTYSYRVRAINNTGPGDWSDTLTYRPGDTTTN